ncbi:hypothetical protein [Tropicibacter naphthalenivorans]|uniref:Uncharacterized protein n=1 Tax=Tropicibacter naphthalenivorans TaxID=441103 RepID=A0A0P1GAS7_9RHOB|nr:hypothetical protein [Tropicibacter naphthalenivorans]CUH78525.1 hypothetical protein TRN7648_02019 [Tropicibacter naphthalenivorans]SMC80852.1 hypothetical protein SAMN04488093_104181 [Tropicibacter naphthalenivorans]
MPRRLKDRMQDKPLLAGAFALTVLFCLFFGAKLVLIALHHPPRPTDPPIANWMTPGYVAHTWHVPKEMMLEVVGPRPGERRETLDEVAERLGITTPELIARIETAIADYRATHPEAAPE